MKTKFSNDDRRFKIDDRFVEDDAENDGDKQEEDDENDEKGEEEEIFEDEDENAKPKKSNKKQLKKEKLNSLRILEEITEKPMLKPIDVDIDDKERSRRLLQKTKPIVRYNPTRRDHKKFEITEERKKEEENEKGSSSSDESEVEVKSTKKKKKNKKDEEETSVPREIPEDKSKFFKIEPNLKDLFSSNDVFKFKFNNDDDDEEIEEEEEDEDASLNQRPKSGLKTSMLFGSNLKKSKYSSSSSEGEDYEEEEEEEEEMDAEFEKRRAVLAKKTTSLDEKINELKSFLPDFDNDKEVNDALKYFGGKESSDLDDFRKDWAANREKLVEVS